MDNIYIIHTKKPLGKIRIFILRKLGCKFVFDNKI